MNYKNKRVFEFKMRLNGEEKKMMDTVYDGGNYESLSHMVRSLIKKEYDKHEPR